VNRIALISTPWPLFNRPSVQLGTLKAYLRQHLEEVEVAAHHVYLEVAAELGYDCYRKISERTWLAESPYAALLYPERSETVSRFWERRASGVFGSGECTFDGLCQSIKHHAEAFVDGEDWQSCALIGFSICLGQLTSTLYFIRQIKRLAPSVPVVVGGSACSGGMGESLLDTFPEIDYVVQGEGERPLSALAGSLLNPGTPGQPLPGVVSRSNREGDRWQVSDLDELPIPDYIDYFQSLGRLDPDRRFLPKIPAEISRGCWWRKRMGQKGTSGCAFCNLNLQWRGYRSKSPRRIAVELDVLADRYQILSISFMDNLLPPRGLERIFEQIRHLGREFRLFSEIRATTPNRILEAMAAAGMEEVQVGIEALSSSLLQKLNKGTRALDNIEIMKNCERSDMPNLTGNLIVGFPTADEADVEQSMENLDYVTPFRPLQTVPFWLGTGSPVWRRPGAFGIKRVRNHPYYRHLFPPAVLRRLRLMVQGFQGVVRYQKRLWRPFEEKVGKWHRIYADLHQRPGSGPILSYRDGGDFLIIRQRRHDAEDMTHRLKGTSRKIYVFCQRQRSMSEILSEFPGFGEERVRPFLRMMADKRLMVGEKDRYLSLAVPARR